MKTIEVMSVGSTYTFEAKGRKKLSVNVNDSGHLLIFNVKTRMLHSKPPCNTTEDKEIIATFKDWNYWKGLP